MDQIKRLEIYLDAATELYREAVKHRDVEATVSSMTRIDFCDKRLAELGEE